MLTYELQKRKYLWTKSFDFFIQNLHDQFIDYNTLYILCPRGNYWYSSSSFFYVQRLKCKENSVIIIVIVVHQILYILLLFYESGKCKLVTILCRYCCVICVSSQSFSALYFSPFGLTIKSKSPYSVRMRENTDQKNS